MRFALCITKATYTHSQYVIPIAYRLQQWLHEHTSILTLYVHCLSVVPKLRSFRWDREAREVDSARGHFAFQHGTLFSVFLTKQIRILIITLVTWFCPVWLFLVPETGSHIEQDSFWITWRSSAKLSDWKEEECHVFINCCLLIIVQLLGINTYCELVCCAEHG
jgi:hypothetical protein